MVPIEFAHVPSRHKHARIAELESQLESQQQ